MMPPIPDRLETVVQVTAILENTTRSDFELMAPTPCDIHFWELYDGDGKRLIQTEPAEDCTQNVVFQRLPAGKSVRGDNIVRLNGRLLVSGQAYLLRYKFWGYKTEASFTARHVF